MLRDHGVECHTRADWGSPREADGSYRRRQGTHPMPAGPARFHYLHITVTSDTDTVRQGAAGARQIEGYGYSTPPMVSYQDLVTNEGRYFEGQSYGVKGTHTVNDKGVAGFPRDLNLEGYATAIMQNVDDEVTDEQVQVVAMIYAARELLGLVRRGAPVYPHRMFAWKACPGDRAVARLDDIERLKRRYVREGLPQIGKVDDMPTPADLWNAEVPEYDPDTRGDDRRAKVLLAQAHRRAGDARDAVKRLEGKVDRLLELVGGEK